MKDFIAKRTLRARHYIVKLIAPSLSGHDPGGVPRPMIEFLNDSHKGNLIGVEIGVGRGMNAESILKTLPMKKLWLIDPYKPYMDDKTLNTRNVGNMVDASKKLEGFKDIDRIVFIYKKSEKAVNLIPSNLDFVYIDGNHSYNVIKKDIELYYPKVRKGGVIGGHDFNINYLGVIKAVLEFVKKHDLKLFGKKADWWVIK